MISLEISQEVINQTLSTFLNEKKTEAESIHPSYVRLISEIERVVFAGGKRLRPHLVFTGYGSYDDAVAKVAAAHELLHVALLIHDDIIDRDALRHGQATIHHNYNITHYAPFIDDKKERNHFSTSAALLAGDLLISSAYELIRQAGLNEAQYQDTTRLLNTAVFEVAAGELLDTESPFIPEAYPPILVYRYKTTSYSFIAPLLTGASLAGTHSAEDLNHLREYAINLGIAYQIKDDCLGVFGEAAETGKSTSGDLREGKQTMLIAEFKKLATREQRDYFDTTFGQPNVTDEELSNLKEAIRLSGALDVTTAISDNYSQRAKAAVHSIKDESLKRYLLVLIDFLHSRNA